MKSYADKFKQFSSNVEIKNDACCASISHKAGKIIFIVKWHKGSFDLMLFFLIHKFIQALVDEPKAKKKKKLWSNEILIKVNNIKQTLNLKNVLI